ncbi:MAG: class I SAM-dependent methyltransferase [Sandaracinaceae bacterium]|nr:class I SAM-dependent methyltransferase [Sandaracinaceae bacterium]
MGNPTHRVKEFGHVISWLNLARFEGQGLLDKEGNLYLHCPLMIRLGLPKLTLKRSYKHWTPKYIVDRIRLMIWYQTHPDSPWLTPAAIEVIDSLLKPSDRYLEWGSGRSTAWFAKRCKEVISVESSPEWFQRVSQTISGMNNVSLRLCPTKEEYLGVGLSLPDESVDVVLVDGQYRDECAEISIPKLRRGGLLIIDNVHWYLPSNSKSPNAIGSRYATPVWERVGKQIESWRKIWLTSGVDDTSIWIRP